MLDYLLTSLTAALTFQFLLERVAFLLTALAYVMRDILLLRSLAVVSGVLWFVLMYFAGFSSLALVEQSLLLTINVVRIVMLVKERRGVSFTEEEQELYRTVFSRFSPVEFLKIIRLAEWRNGGPGELLAVQNQPVNHLIMIYNGEVAIVKEDHEVVHLRDGTMIGEMSFLRGGNATATVRVVRPTRYVAWPQEDLRKLLRRNPTMDVAMQSVLSADLINKLTSETAAVAASAGAK
ncbi:MAG: cyclic nucleotide-binding domain-containing protein [Candidatus Tectomicrobia bacterium]|uniref:Cyclic nucleotide-binding domain-containing protein n=1 Tax=Tectimicrobiota bacterium TaxID=2528274 RepID=A0A932I1E4_UNCTE|nr:cyclic nucleotide-binding domain-containing protein [Candidatus Tectomicrobia bacterium]